MIRKANIKILATVDEKAEPLENVAGKCKEVICDIGRCVTGI